VLYRKMAFLPNFMTLTPLSMARLRRYGRGIRVKLENWAARIERACRAMHHRIKRARERAHEGAFEGRLAAMALGVSGGSCVVPSEVAALVLHLRRDTPSSPFRWMQIQAEKRNSRNEWHGYWTLLEVGMAEEQCLTSLLSAPWWQSIAPEL
jgi:hypothetical protein